MASSYDVSSSVRKNLEEKAKRRAVLREEFIKQSTDPFRMAKGEGGYVFDPAVQRFIAMKINSFEHFRPTPKNVRLGLGLVILPMFLFGYIVQTSRASLEKKYRSGEVAYKDRRFKTI